MTPCAWRGRCHCQSTPRSTPVLARGAPAVQRESSRMGSNPRSVPASFCDSVGSICPMRHAALEGCCAGHRGRDQPASGEEQLNRKWESLSQAEPSRAEGLPQAPVQGHLPFPRETLSSQELKEKGKKTRILVHASRDTADRWGSASKPQRPVHSAAGSGTRAAATPQGSGALPPSRCRRALGREAVQLRNS